MHELSITQNIVALVSERAEGHRVTRVTVEIGKLNAIVPDAIQFCFGPCTKGTALEGAQLEIHEIAGRGRCRECGRELKLTQPYGQCACGSFHIECISGDQMRIKEMEVA
jgi:hydrogenase nickel incorporation protein HypA/HybF